MTTISQVYLGPRIPVGIARQYFLYSHGLAPSYVPNALLSSDKPIQSPVEKLVLKHKVDSECIAQLEDDLKNHIEGRIQLFLNQLLLVYQTKLPFDLCKQAETQVGQVLSTEKREGSYAGAHSGTLPTLRIAQPMGGDTSISFAKNSSFYYAWNTTIYLPEIANQIDSSIDATLRKKATELLNKVSAGKGEPKEALSQFLQSLVDKIKELETREPRAEKKQILRIYLSTAENYYDNLENGYPLIQKLCLRPLTAPLDPAFYTSLQEEMLAKLRIEMGEPEETDIPELPQDLDMALLQTQLSKGLHKRKLSATREGYIKLCTSAQTVQSAAAQYLLLWHGLSPQTKLSELAQMQKSSRARPFRESVLQTIGREVRKAPQNQELIFSSVLLNVGRNFLPSQAAPIPSEEVKQRLQDQIKQALQLAKLLSSTTAETYIKLCAKAAKVEAAAQRFFNELAQMPEPLCESEIAKLFAIKTKKKIGNVGLSPTAYAFYAAVQETIGRDARNMPLILCRLLLGKMDLKNMGGKGG